MTTLYKYKLRCLTENKDETTWGDSEPTQCPTNPLGHTIDTNSIRIIDKISESTIHIKEEDTPTGGNFQSTSIKVNAVANTTTSTSISWPYPINALLMSFVTTNIHTGDIINASVAKNDTIGTLSADLIAFSTWSSQNYVVNNQVQYQNKLYKCIQNTSNNEEPTNSLYWEYITTKLYVSGTVINYTSIGHHVALNDGTNSNDMGRIISIDKVNNTISTEYTNTNTFDSSTPTYVKQTRYYLRNFELGESTKHTIGNSKIGGSYIPANTNITVEYENKSSSTTKTIIGTIEYLY